MYVRQHWLFRERQLADASARAGSKGEELAGGEAQRVEPRTCEGKPGATVVRRVVRTGWAYGYERSGERSNLGIRHIRGGAAKTTMVAIKSRTFIDGYP
jgi:hypothetical protein